MSIFDVFNPNTYRENIARISKRTKNDPTYGGLEAANDLFGGFISDAVGTYSDNVWKPIERAAFGEAEYSNVNKYTPSKEELARRDAFQSNFAINRNRQQNRDAMDNLRRIVQQTPTLTNEELRARAQKKVAPIFRPQIRQTKRSIRQTERQGRIAAKQVQGYYDQAGNKVSGIAKSSRKANRRAIKQTMAGGIQGNRTAEKQSGIAAQAMKGMGKANASFFKQMQAALAGEGAVAAADTRRNYKDVANTYRQDLADLRTERAAKTQEVVQGIRQNINKTARKVYDDTYLGLIQQGIPARQAQKAALAQAGTYGQAIEARAAQMMLRNKENEKLLAGMQKKKGMTEEQWDRKQDRIDNNQFTQSNLRAIMTSPNTTPEQKRWAAQQLGAPTEGL